MNESKTPDTIKYRFTTIFKIVIFQGNLNPLMFISNSKKFIYIHLHKCAGTTVELALSRSLKWNDILIGSTVEGEALQNIYLKLFGLHKHSTAQEVKGVIGDVSWEGFFKFSTVRNPYSLAVSQYTFSLQQLLGGIERLKIKPLIEGTLDINRYNMWPFTYPGVQALLSTGGISSKFSDFIRSKKLTDWKGFSTQLDQLGNEKGDLIVDQAIKIEEFDVLWPRLCEKLNLGAIELGRENQSKDRALDYRYFYNKTEDQEFIYKMFKKDFDCFNYAKNL